MYTCALKFGTSFLSIHICEHTGDEVDFSPPNTQFPDEREMLTDLKRGDFTEWSSRQTFNISPTTNLLLLDYKSLYYSHWKIQKIKTPKHLALAAPFSYILESSYLARRKCTFFEPVYFSQRKGELLAYFCPFWPMLAILSWIYALICVILQA